jgi:hypothetical protein
MDKKTIFELGSYLNDRIGPYNTCNHELNLTTVWLNENGRNVEEDLVWLHEQSVTCDCQVVINLYIPMLFGMVKTKPSDSASRLM